MLVRFILAFVIIINIMGCTTPLFDNSIHINIKDNTDLENEKK